MRRFRWGQLKRIMKESGSADEHLILIILSDPFIDHMSGLPEDCPLARCRLHRDTATWLLLWPLPSCEFRSRVLISGLINYTPKKHLIWEFTRAQVWNSPLGSLDPWSTAPLLTEFRAAGRPIYGAWYWVWWLGSGLQVRHHEMTLWPPECLSIWRWHHVRLWFRFSSYSLKFQMWHILHLDLDLYSDYSRFWRSAFLSSKIFR